MIISVMPNIKASVHDLYVSLLNKLSFFHSKTLRGRDGSICLSLPKADWLRNGLRVGLASGESPAAALK